LLTTVNVFIHFVILSKINDDDDDDDGDNSVLSRDAIANFSVMLWQFCLSVRPSVTVVSRVETAKFIIFLTLSSSIILISRDINK